MLKGKGYYRMAKKRRKPSEKRARHHEKIKNKIREIRSRDNVVDFSISAIEEVMKKHNIETYNADPWGDLRVKSKYDSWIAYEANGVIYLLHANGRIKSAGYRGDYHIQNVFYDLDYCVKSIVEHDEYKARGHRR